MVPVVNSVLIAITIIVLTYFLLNIKNELNSFENIYNKEQDYKHSKLQKTFGDIDNNEQQLKGKTDEHNEILTTHTNLLKNSEKGDAIVDGNPDIAENDVYSLITHNNKLINDNYSAVFNILEKNESDDATMLKGPNVSGGNKKTKIKMEKDGNIKINVTSPDKVKVCDIDDNNCKKIVLQEDKLCINDTCIVENDLKRLKGEVPIFIEHSSSGRILQGENDGTGLTRFANTNRGSWERMFLK